MTDRRTNPPAWMFPLAKTKPKTCDECQTPANGNFLLRAPCDPPTFLCRKCYAKWNEPEAAR